MEDPISNLTVQFLASSDPVEAIFIGRKLRKAISEHLEYLHGKAHPIEPVTEQQE